MLCILTNCSEVAPNGEHRYSFWFGGECVTLTADKAFGHGDLAELRYEDESTKTYEFRILEEAEAPINKISQQVYIPTISFAVTKPVSHTADYQFKIVDNKHSSIMKVYSKTLGKNKIYCLVLKLYPGVTKVLGEDSVTGTKLSFSNRVSVKRKVK